MNDYHADDSGPWHKAWLWQVSFVFLGVVAFVVLGSALEEKLGVPWETSYRLGCATACLVCIYQLAQGYPGERWPWISFWLAMLASVAVFFTPLVDRAASRGEIMIFALPSAVIFLLARIATYPVCDARQRAMRQQMLLALIVALILCVAVFLPALAEPQRAR